MNLLRLFTLFFFIGIGSTVGQDRFFITFQIKMGDQEIFDDGMHIAGTFGSNAASITSDWNPAAAGSKLELVGPKLYQVKINFPKSAAGEELFFQFMRDSLWLNTSGDISEGNPGDCCLEETCARVSANGERDRRITLPRCDARYVCEWNQCGELVSEPAPTLSTAPQLRIFCPDSPLQLSAITNGTLSWEPNPGLSCLSCPEPLFAGFQNTTVYVQATKSNCRIRDSIRLEKLYFEKSETDSLRACGSVSIPIEIRTNGNISVEPASAAVCLNCRPLLLKAVGTGWVKIRSSAGGCSLVDSVYLQALPAPQLQLLGPGLNDILCQGDTALLQAQTDGLLHWLNPASGCADCPEQRYVSDKGAWYAARAEKNGCQVKDSLYVNRHFMELAGKDRFCKGELMLLTSSSNGTNHWFDAQKVLIAQGLAQIGYYADTSTWYYVESTTPGGCRLKDSIRIQVDTIKVRVSRLGPEEILLGESIRLQASGAPGFRWIRGENLDCSNCPSPMAQPQASGWYVAESEPTSTCGNRDSVFVKVREDCSQLAVPNFFTRNGDGQNEDFRLSQLLGAQACALDFEEVVVFDRWGRRIFQSEDPAFRFPSEDSQKGIFFFDLRFRQKRFQGWWKVDG